MTQLNFESPKSACRALGSVLVEKVYPDGKREVLSHSKNLVVNTGLSTLVALQTQQAGVDPVELAVHSMWIESSPTAFANPVLATDTGPTGTVVKRAVFDRASDLDVGVGGNPGLLEYRAELSATEGNGEIIRAAGLYTRSDDDDPALATAPVLFARQIFGAFPKDDKFVLSFKWRIEYSAV